MNMVSALRTPLAALALALAAMPAYAEIDGHGPDAWRVTGVPANDVLNVRMGPGTNYPVIETFAHNERGMQQITCVPFYTAAHYMAMTQTQIKALPPRWCLMRNKAMSKAGWVAQNYITPEGEESGSVMVSRQKPQESGPYINKKDIDPVVRAQDLVREVYEREFHSENSGLPSAFDPTVA